MGDQFDERSDSDDDSDDDDNDRNADLHHHRDNNSVGFDQLINEDSDDDETNHSINKTSSSKYQGNKSPT